MSELDAKDGGKENREGISENQISRRKFFEVSAVAGAAGAGAGDTRPRTEARSRARAGSRAAPWAPGRSGAPG